MHLIILFTRRQHQRELGVWNDKGDLVETNSLVNVGPLNQLDNTGRRWAKSASIPDFFMKPLSNGNHAVFFGTSEYQVNSYDGNQNPIGLTKNSLYQAVIGSNGEILQQPSLITEASTPYVTGTSLLSIKDVSKAEGGYNLEYYTTSYRGDRDPFPTTTSTSFIAGPSLSETPYPSEATLPTLAKVSMLSQTIRVDTPIFKDLKPEDVPPNYALDEGLETIDPLEREVSVAFLEGIDSSLKLSPKPNSFTGISGEMTLASAVDFEDFLISGSDIKTKADLMERAYWTSSSEYTLGENLDSVSSPARRLQSNATDDGYYYDGDVYYDANEDEVGNDDTNVFSEDGATPYLVLDLPDNQVVAFINPQQNISEIFQSFRGLDGMEKLPAVPSKLPTPSPSVRQTLVPTVRQTVAQTPRQTSGQTPLQTIEQTFSQTNASSTLPPAPPAPDDDQYGMGIESFFKGDVKILGKDVPKNIVYPTSAGILLAGVGLAYFCRKKCTKKDREVQPEMENAAQRNEAQDNATPDNLIPLRQVNTRQKPAQRSQVSVEMV